MFVHRHDHALRRQADLLRSGLQDAGIRLMRDQPVDPVLGQAGVVQHLAQGSGHVGDGVAKDFPPLHAQMPHGARGGRSAIDKEQLAVATVGVQAYGEHARTIV